MIIEDNKITLYTDECMLQPTQENSYISYTFEQFHETYTEGLIVHRENYRRIKRIFQEGYSTIEISVIK